MDAKLQLRVQRYGWDKAANEYELGWQAQLAPAQARLLETASPAPGERVLDIACGTGLVTFPLAERVGHGGAVVGTDLSQRMVEAARARAAVLEYPNVTFTRMGAEALELEDASFDLTVCALGLMYGPNPRRALLEMRRVLKPGGRAAVLVWGERRNCGWAEVFPIVDARVQSAVCPMFFQLGGRGVLEGALSEASFAQVRLERMQVTLKYATGDAACHAVFAGGPVALANQHFDAATRSAAYEEYLASITAFRDGAGYAIPGEFVIAVGLAAP